MSAVEFVQITKTELEAVVFEASLKAFNKGMEMAQEQDLMLTMSEICEKTKMSEYGRLKFNKIKGFKVFCCTFAALE